MRKRVLLGAVIAIGVALVALAGSAYVGGWRWTTDTRRSGGALAPPVPDRASPKARKLAETAMRQVGRTVSYDATYREIAYPGGDVPIRTGVCTDVLVRGFREVGLDLQVAVHEDMARHFSVYPHKWRLTAPDTNIDHRRVPNLRTYFTRRGFALPITKRGIDYQPGDVVTWKVMGLPHTGIVSTTRAGGGQHFRIAHNFGSGTRIEDILFSYEITGHYRVY